jgi:hypothetical protein
LERDIVVQYVAQRYFAPKQVKEKQFAVKRKWSFKNPNLYLHPISLAPVFSPKM